MQTTMQPLESPHLGMHRVGALAQLGLTRVKQPMPKWINMHWESASHACQDLTGMLRDTCMQSTRLVGSA